MAGKRNSISPKTCAALQMASSSMDMADLFSAVESGFNTTTGTKTLKCINILHHHYPSVLRGEDYRDTGERWFLIFFLHFPLFVLAQMKVNGKGMGSSLGGNPSLTTHLLTGRRRNSPTHAITKLSKFEHQLETKAASVEGARKNGNCVAIKLLAWDVDDGARVSVDIRPTSCVHLSHTLDVAAWASGGRGRYVSDLGASSACESMTQENYFSRKQHKFNAVSPNGSA